MNSNLTIKPKNGKKIILSDDLKRALRKLEMTNNYSIDESYIFYFKALDACCIKDADLVISMIEKHGSCILNQEF